MTSSIITEHTNGRTRQDLVDVLVSQHVDVLVDARLNTILPYDGRFYPEHLGKDLEAVNIEYIRARQLGNPFKNMTDVTVMEREYRQMAVGTEQFQELLARIRDEDKVFCLLCYCKPPRPCHRFWLRDLFLQSTIPS